MMLINVFLYSNLWLCLCLALWLCMIVYDCVGLCRTLFLCYFGWCLVDVWWVCMDVRLGVCLGLLRFDFFVGFYWLGIDVSHYLICRKMKMVIIVNWGGVSVEWNRPWFIPIQSRCIFSILSGIKYQNIPIFKNDHLLPVLTICVWCTFDALATQKNLLEFQQNKKNI